jgi:hypothetical protein
MKPFGTAFANSITNEGEKKKKWRAFGLETSEIRDVPTNFEFLEVEYDD